MHQKTAESSEWEMSHTAKSSKIYKKDSVGIMMLVIKSLALNLRCVDDGSRIIGPNITKSLFSLLV